MQARDARAGQDVRVDLKGLELVVPEARGSSVLGEITEVNLQEDALRVRITLPAGQQRNITVSPRRVGPR